MSGLTPRVKELRRARNKATGLVRPDIRGATADDLRWLQERIGVRSLSHTATVAIRHLTYEMQHLGLKEPYLMTEDDYRVRPQFRNRVDKVDPEDISFL